MRASSLFLAFSILLCAAGGAAWVGVLAADWLESRSLAAADAALSESHHDWVVVDTDGLQVRLTGIADSEADRFAVLSAVATAIDDSRIIDLMEVVEARPPAPEFSIEILRDQEGVSLIGLVPYGYDTGPLLAVLAGSHVPVTDLLQSADFPIPAGFEVAADFAARAALKLDRAKISVTATKVTVAATADSQAARQKAQAELGRMASDSFVLSLDIRAPRPVITPFALRFQRDGTSARFDVCAAATAKGRDAILNAAVRAGLSGKADCTIGLGAPSPDWSVAVVRSIQALAEMGAGALTVRDADISLVVEPGIEPAAFKRITGDLRTALPAPFSLQAILKTPRKAGSPDETSGFLAELDPGGQVHLRGALDDDTTAQAVAGFAAARFGAEMVDNGTVRTGGLPTGWPLRVLTGLDALSKLSSGEVEVTPEHVALRGVSGSQDTRAVVAALLTKSLGDGGSYAIDVAYDEALDPLAALPTPEECLARVSAVQAEAKISFEPGKATIDPEGLKLIDSLAEALTDCETVAIEVGGHTDSQGRESMNLTLSQTRAEAVVDALASRRVLTGNLVAKGYGETQPIADNDTEEGREANRRIEFRLIPPAADPSAETADDATAADETASEESDEQN